MLLRAQSIFLLLIAAAGIIMLFLPISTIKITTSGFEDSQTRIIEMNAFEKMEITGGENIDAGKNKLLPVSIILSVITSLSTLLFFQNRAMKMKLYGLNYVFICTTVVLIFFYCDIQSSVKNINMSVDYHAAALLPFIQLLGNFLGLRKIKSG